MNRTPLPAAPANAIFVIHPYKVGNSWVFDDDRVGLVREPFVAGADTLLELFAKGRTEMDVLFSTNEFPGFECKVTKTRGEAESGTYYWSEDLKQEIWLCPAQSLYLNPSPNTIYMQTK